MCGEDKLIVGRKAVVHKCVGIILFNKKRKRFRPVSSDVSKGVKYTEREARVQERSGVVSRGLLPRQSPDVINTAPVLNPCLPFRVLHIR